MKIYKAQSVESMCEWHVLNMFSHALVSLPTDLAHSCCLLFSVVMRNQVQMSRHMLTV